MAAGRQRRRYRCGGEMRNHQVYTKPTDPKAEQTPGVHGSFDVVYDPFFFLVSTRMHDGIYVYQAQHKLVRNSGLRRVVDAHRQAGIRRISNLLSHPSLIHKVNSLLLDHPVDSLRSQATLYRSSSLLQHVPIPSFFFGTRTIALSSF
jgi:hypothetical protein